MADITASMVKELREITGLGMMECKKALVETSGDITAAEDLLRIKSGAKAIKRQVERLLKALLAHILPLAIKRAH